MGSTLPEVFRGGPAHGEELGAGDDSITLPEKDGAPRVGHVRVEGALIRESEQLDFDGLIVRTVAERALQHGGAVFGEQRKHGILVRVKLLDAAGRRPEQTAEGEFIGGIGHSATVSRAARTGPRRGNDGRIAT